MNKKQSIKSKVLVVPMIVMMIVVAIISSITIMVSNKIMLNQMKHDGMALSKQLSDRISESKSYSNIIGNMFIDKLLSISNRINDSKEKIDDNYVKKLCIDFNVDEINITDKSGKVIFSNKKECKNKVFKNNMFATKALNGAEPRFEKIRKCIENNNYYKYGYYKINTGGIVQIGIEANKLSKLNKLTDPNDMVKKISNVKEIEYALIIDKNLKVLAHSDNSRVGKVLDDIGSKTAVKEGKPYSSKYLYKKNNEIVYDVVYPIYVDGKQDGAVDLGLCMESLDAQKKHVVIIIVLVALICVAVLFIIMTKICKGIIYPVEKLVYISREVADGNLVVEINSNSNDEIGVLSLGFKKMCDKLKNTMGIIKDESIKVNSMANELNSNMDNINASSSDIAKAIQDVAEGALEQNKDIVNSISNMDDLSEELDNINNKLINIKDLSDNTENKANSGKEDINLLLKSIKQVEGSFNVVYKKIQGLDNRVLQIESITDVINSISEQTNLLALNAAIEAARAGESGKGFAVVADEVRKLADQSKKSINDIKNLISGIEDESKNVIDTSGKVNSLVEEQSSMIETTLESLNDMLSSVENINPLITDVYQSIENTIKSKDTVAEKLNNIAIVSERTSATSQEIAAASEEMAASATEVLSFTNNMKQVAEKLNDETNKFSLE